MPALGNRVTHVSWHLLSTTHADQTFLKSTLLSRQFLFPGAAFGTLILYLYLANVIILKNSASLPLPEGPSYPPPSHLDLPRTL